MDLGSSSFGVLWPSISVEGRETKQQTSFLLWDMLYAALAQWLSKSVSAGANEKAES